MNALQKKHFFSIYVDKFFSRHRDCLVTLFSKDIKSTQVSLCVIIVVRLCLTITVNYEDQTTLFLLVFFLKL